LQFNFFERSSFDFGLTILRQAEAKRLIQKPKTCPVKVHKKLITYNFQLKCTISKQRHSSNHCRGDGL